MGVIGYLCTDARSAMLNDTYFVLISAFSVNISQLCAGISFTILSSEKTRFTTEFTYFAWEFQNFHDFMPFFDKVL